jgi:polysaccharide export outer membrane protein
MKKLFDKAYRFIRINVKVSLVYFGCVFILSSCVTQRNLEYLHKDKKAPAEFSEPQFTEYHLQPNDALYIQISSLDDASTNIFAQSGRQQFTLDPYSAYLSSYTIDQEGYIQLPVIGRIKATGKTTLQVSQMIKDSVENILSLPVVSVKLVNQYVSILGEVNSPGHYIYSQDKFTIFNALGLAGDITPYGNRKQVILTRNEDGKTIHVNFDLTSSDILSSKYYYVQPNDMIYVKPLSKRLWGMEQFPFTIIMSIITTGIVVYTFIQQQ